AQRADHRHGCIPAVAGKTGATADAEDGGAHCIGTIDRRRQSVKWEDRIVSSMASINLSSRDLDAFLALAQAQHFTRAAEKGHLSQSAFSQKIARIEQNA